MPEAPEEFSARELELIGAMLRCAARLDGDELFHVEAVQELACLTARYEQFINDDDIAVLIGLGALLARQGNMEMKAAILSKLALDKAMLKS